MKPKPLTFPEFIRDFGPTKLARALGLAGPSACHKWAERVSWPDPDRASILITLSKKRLTVEEIYRGRKDGAK